MQIKEKIQKIEEFIDKYIDHDKVLKGIDTALEYGNVVPIEQQETEHCVINVLMEKVIGSYDISNDLSPNRVYVPIYIPSIDLKSNANIRCGTSDYRYQPDILSTETGIEELDEMVFNYSLMFGNFFDVNRFLLMYVCYKRYLNHVPSGSEMKITFQVLGKVTSIYEYMGIE